MMRWAMAFAAAIALMSPRPSHALAVCTTSAASMSFGVYDPTSGTPNQTTGSVTVSCDLIGGISLLVSYTIALSSGSGAYLNRALLNGAATLNYNLYTSGSFSSIWGDGNGGTSTVSDGYLLGLLGAVRNYTVYGRVPALQNIPAGTYADSIIVTVTY